MLLSVVRETLEASANVRAVSSGLKWAEEQTKGDTERHDHDYITDLYSNEAAPESGEWLG